MKTKRWAIIGKCGLYVGQSITRLDMIVQHVAARCYARDGGRIRNFAFNRLDPEQRFAWRQCQRQGDRCVRVEIREIKKKGAK